MMVIEPVTLEGRWLRLEPLADRHAEGLAAVAGSDEIWRLLPTAVRTIEEMRAWVGQALAGAQSGQELPFVQIDRATGAPIGSTRIMDIRPEHRAAEIGYTWLGRDWWRTHMNSEAKFLLLSYLFETAGCQRVTLKTDLLNVRSQRAIERLGAVREGVLRKHMIVQEGRSRDSVYYSILDDEWPAIRERMERELYAGANGPSQ